MKGRHLVACALGVVFALAIQLAPVDDFTRWNLRILWGAAAAAALLGFGSSSSSWLTGSCLALLLAAGHALMRRQVPELPPSDVIDWPFWVLAPGLVWGAYDARRDVPPRLRWGVGVSLAFLLAGLLLLPRLPRDPTAALVILGVGGLTAVLWVLLERISSQDDGDPVRCSLVVAAGGGALAIGLSGSLLLAWLAAVPAAALLGQALTSPEREPQSRSTTPIVLVALAGAWLCGRLYADLPTISLALLGGAPAGALLARVPLLRSRPTLVAMGGSGLLTAAAVLVAWVVSPSFDGVV